MAAKTHLIEPEGWKQVSESAWQAITRHIPEEAVLF